MGRTTQVWNRFRRGGLFEENPWALRFFDRIEWYPVSARNSSSCAPRPTRAAVTSTPRRGSSPAEHEAFLAENAASIAAFREQQTTAFEAEKERWRASGEFDVRPEPAPAVAAGPVDLPAGAVGVEAPFAATVWQVSAAAGPPSATGTACWRWRP